MACTKKAMAKRGMPQDADRSVAKDVRRGLVVDDNGAAREVLRRLLSAEGFRCDTVSSGEEAMARVGDHATADVPYDMLFVDIMMPGMDGLELTRRMRAIDERPAIVVVTGVADTARAREALRLGADEYVVKPYSISQLRLAWEQALERRRDLERKRRTARGRAESTDIIFHDLRNPLAVARGYLSLMDSCRGAVVPADIRAAAQGCELAIDILEQGEDLGRIERSEFTVEKTPVHLREAVGGIAEKLKPLADEAGKRILVLCREDIPTVEADPGLVGRILSALVAGALKYAPGGSDAVLELSTSRDGLEVFATLTDDGPVVPPELREAMFDRERQGELRRARSRRGLALSLPFARAACRQMGARIWVGSPGDGPGATSPDDERTGSAGGTSAMNSRDGCRFTVAFPATATCGPGEGPRGKTPLPAGSMARSWTPPR